MTKRQLESALKKLDKALEALEHLNEAGVIGDIEHEFDWLVSRKSEVENVIEQRSKGGA